MTKTKRLTLADLTETETNRVAACIHEAAHAVLAALSGATVTQCYTSADGSGRTEYFGHDPQREREIAWAGPFAEALFLHQGAPTSDQLDALLAGASAEDREALRGVRVWSVESEVRFAMPAIRRLASRLWAQESVNNTEVRQALGIRPGLDIEAVRHAYRNGIRPEDITLPGEAVA